MLHSILGLSLVKNVSRRKSLVCQGEELQGLEGGDVDCSWILRTFWLTGTLYTVEEKGTHFLSQGKGAY